MTLKFLTPDDPEDLTDYKSAADRTRWLQSRGYAFELRRDDKNRVRLGSDKISHWP